MAIRTGGGSARRRWATGIAPGVSDDGDAMSARGSAVGDVVAERQPMVGRRMQGGGGVDPDGGGG
ncbi:hypothetical protein E2562_034257 [Oryza meyeriana var. granulata]|uniref:DUF834 domain-containing protein n=1 Tax=Oryza meyeriana var. granulata TaxID=110450 RepID=A0A6G1ESB4_9ORYZ|nr:hypothetical protein E2562_034257 [Oryza meyeriana var. granulata]